MPEGLISGMFDGEIKNLKLLVMLEVWQGVPGIMYQFDFTRAGHLV